MLLDECLPRGFRRDLPGHEILTVQEEGWAGVKNGTLLRRVGEAGFNVFITVDKGIEFQQRLADATFGVIALRAPSNDVSALRPLMPAVLDALQTLRAGQVVRFRSDRRLTLRCSAEQHG